jgi:mRNA-degrading endonuclease RelE of RelBE toxin-antitoxin system
MVQVIFNGLSAAEMSALPKMLQIELMGELSSLPEDPASVDPSKFGVIEREGRRLHRFRAKDYRIYFEVSDQGVLIHRVLHKNTIRDFLFRAKLPMAEDEQLGDSKDFWHLIEEGERKGRDG